MDRGAWQAIVYEVCLYMSGWLKEKSGLVCSRIEGHQCLGVLDIVSASQVTRI